MERNWVILDLTGTMSLDTGKFVFAHLTEEQQKKVKEASKVKIASWSCSNTSEELARHAAKTNNYPVDIPTLSVEEIENLLQ